MKTKTLLTITCAGLLSISASAQFDGTIDTAFGTNGKTTFDYGGTLGNESLSKSIVDNNNNIIYSFGTHKGNADINALITAHSSVDGSTVTTFGGKGYVGFDPQIGANDMFLSGAVQSNGKIIAVGATIGGSIDMLVARFNADGTLDKTFSGNGYEINDGGVGGDDVLYDVALQKDGKVVLCGVAETNNGYESFVARLNTDGSPDGTFGTGGFVYVQLDGVNIEQFNTVNVLSDGNIILGGNAGNDYSIYMLDTDGKPTTYSVDGKVVSKINSKPSRIVKILETSDNKLIVVGETIDPTDGKEMFVMKQSMGGNWLLSFEGGGIYAADLDSTDQGDTTFAVMDAELLPDGNLMIVGTYEDGFNTAEAGIYMLSSADGKLVSTWGDNGFRRYGSGNGKALANPNIEVLADGNVIISFRNYVASNDFVIRKLLKDAPVQVSTGETLTNISNVNVYPNPTNNMLYIDIESTESTNATITIMDLAGKTYTTKEVSLTQGDNTAYLTNEVSTLQNGFYLITVTTNNGSETIKFIKQ